MKLLKSEIPQSKETNRAGSGTQTQCLKVEDAVTKIARTLTTTVANKRSNRARGILKGLIDGGHISTDPDDGVLLRVAVNLFNSVKPQAQRGVTLLSGPFRTLLAAGALDGSEPLVAQHRGQLGVPAVSSLVGLDSPPDLLTVRKAPHATPLKVKNSARRSEGTPMFRMMSCAVWTSR